MCFSFVLNCNNDNDLSLEQLMASISKHISTFKTHIMFIQIYLMSLVYVVIMSFFDILSNNRT